MVNTITKSVENGLDLSKKTEQELQADFYKAFKSGDNQLQDKISNELEKRANAQQQSPENLQPSTKKFNEYKQEELKKMKKADLLKLIQDGMDQEKNNNRLGGAQDMMAEELKRKLLGTENKTAILEKQNKELMDMVFNKEELIISPKEYFKRSRLVRAKQKLDELKNKDPKQAIIHFLALTKWYKGGKPAQIIKEFALKSNVAGLFSNKIENLKTELKDALAWFEKDQGDSTKVRFMKTKILNSIKEIVNKYFQNIAEKNKI